MATAARMERGVAAGIPYAALGAGRPVVVLAGASPITGVADDLAVRGMLPPVQDLAGPRRVIVLNRWPGMAAGTTIAALADRTAEAIGELGGGPVDIVGSSTGGAIAQQLAATRPEAVRRLVLASTAGRLGSWGRSRQARIAQRLEAGDARGASELLVGALLPARLRSVGAPMGGRVGERFFTGPESLRDLAITLWAEDRFDLSALDPIPVPTLLVSGANDPFYPAEEVRWTADLIPDSRVHLEPRAGHIITGQRRAVRRAVAEFLGRV